ncbi:cyclin protein [Ophiocordyceps camponoti-floridani]|uniref:Cyclin protein n=1 Tax=Ophiocordyceps camponoti-floridani TaxID=2030778 RepID=A0A8H4Q5W8_9HYPO|nr:cyclin protein [Ophiocordyceps camponoti-floridani]
MRRSRGGFSSEAQQSTSSTSSPQPPPSSPPPPPRPIHPLPLNAPLETIALAVCILDSLDARFGRTWRLTCPLQPPPTTTPHIDAIRPELIILAALVLAAKFTVESHRQTRFYCKRWGAGLWSHAQLNATERCIVEALDYRIMPLWKEDCLADALVDMQLAAGVDRLREPSPPASVAW